MKTKNTKKINNRNKIIVAVSGGFDPIHIGHIRLMKEAKKLGDELVVILNNDNWFKIKGREGFMNEKDRKEIIESISYVDRVILTKHKPTDKVFDRTSVEYSVCKELRLLKPDIFANGGDRFADDVPEVSLCRDLGIKTVFNVGKGGKVRSSSELLNEYSKKIKNKK